MTDLGHAPQSVRDRLRESDVVVVEANHCPRMLEADPRRSWTLKRRIGGRHGHLSNERMSELLSSVASPRWRRIYLAHLSRDCNSRAAVEHALGAVRGAPHLRILDRGPRRGHALFRSRMTGPAEGAPRTRAPFRRTKIIFTARAAPARARRCSARLIRAGADIVRLNMAHGSHDWTRAMIRRIRAVSARVGRDVAIMMDIKGPEIRTGDLAVPIELRPGETFDFTVKPGAPRENSEEIRSVDVNYQDLSTTSGSATPCWSTAG